MIVKSWGGGALPFYTSSSGAGGSLAVSFSYFNAAAAHRSSSGGE